MQADEAPFRREAIEGIKEAPKGISIKLHHIPKISFLKVLKVFVRSEMSSGVDYSSTALHFWRQARGQWPSSTCGFWYSKQLSLIKYGQK